MSNITWRRLPFESSKAFNTQGTPPRQFSKEVIEVQIDIDRTHQQKHPKTKGNSTQDYFNQMNLSTSVRRKLYFKTKNLRDSFDNKPIVAAYESEISSADHKHPEQAPPDDVKEDRRMSVGTFRPKSGN
ncbi:hypothetical protein M8J77_001987 [Diaphorina citri]|nr:hypothetical protein M8J77_001987 [Diaphorina citri]